LVNNQSGLKGKIMGFVYKHVDSIKSTVGGSSDKNDFDAILDHFRFDINNVFTEPYLGYLFFLVGKSDNKVMDWLVDNIDALDSLTGKEIAFFIVTREIPFSTRKKTELTGLKRSKNLEQLKNSKIEPLIKEGRISIDFSKNVLQDMTYAVDNIAKNLGILSSLPCLLIFDAKLSKKYGVLKLNTKNTISIIPLLREVIDEINKDISIFSQITRYHNLKRNIARINQEIESQTNADIKIPERDNLLKQIEYLEPEIHTLNNNSCVKLVEKFCKNYPEFLNNYNIMNISDKEQFYGKNWLYSPSQEIVKFLLTLPPQNPSENTLHLCVWAYTEDKKTEIEKLSQEIYDKSTQLEITSSSNSDIKSIFQINCTLYGENYSKQLFWDGKVGSALFIIPIPETRSNNQKDGLIQIRYEESLLGQIQFTLNLINKQTPNIDTKNRRFTSAFISYASQDRGKVLARIQGMMKAAPDLEIFMDIKDIKSGEFWKDRLKEAIRDSDIFYLFWSQHAKKSLWVNREIKCALQCVKNKGESFISPIPLESPEDSPPLDELKNLHFNDPILPYIKNSEERSIEGIIKKLFRI
jgi:hypothetical protein